MASIADDQHVFPVGLSEEELRLALSQEQEQSPEVEIKLKPENLKSPIKKLLEETYDDNTWKRLAQKSGVLWDIVQIFKNKSDMSYKVAVSGALGILSGLTKRDQYIDLKQENLRFNLLILLVGESGWIRKTTTRNVVYDLLMLLRSSNGLEIIPPNFTPEGLHDELKSSPNAMIVADELSGFFKKLKKDYMEHMPETISDIYDNKEEISSRTRGKGRMVLKRPFLRMWAATTPTAMISNLEDDHFTQGMLARFCFIYEDDLFRETEKLGFYGSTIDEDTSKISDRLMAMGNSLTKVLLAREKPQLFDEFEDYCEERKKFFFKQGEKLVVPYYARLPQRALKIAGLLQLAWMSEIGSNMVEMILLPEWIETGVKYAKLMEHDFLKIVYEYRTQAPSVKHTTQERRFNHIQNTLKQHDGVLSKTILHRKANIEDKQFTEVLSTLMSMDLIGMRKADKNYLVEIGILKTKDDPYPVRSRPPMVIYHKETLVENLDSDFAKSCNMDIECMAIKIWLTQTLEDQSRSKKK